MDATAASFGQVDDEFLLAMEERHSQAVIKLRRENAALGSAIEHLRSKLVTAESKLEVAKRQQQSQERQERENAKARREAEAGTAHAAANDRLLAERARRAQQQAEQQLATVQQQLAAAQDRVAQQDQEAACTAHQLGSLQAERQALQAELARERPGRQAAAAQEQELRNAAAAERSRAGRAEARCQELERQLSLAQEALRQVELAAAPPVLAASARPRPLWGAGSCADQAPSEAPSLSLRQLADLDDLESLQHQEGTAQQHNATMPTDACQVSDEATEEEVTERQAGLQALLRHVLDQQAALEQRQQALQYQQEQQQPNMTQGAGSSRDQETQALRQQVAKLQHRCTRLQTALADAHLQLSRVQRQRSKTQESGAAGPQKQQHQLALEQGPKPAEQAPCQSLNGAAATGAATAATCLAERLHSQLADYASRLAGALEANASLVAEKQRALERVAALEAELEERTAEVARLRMQRLCLASARGAGAGATALEQCQRMVLEAQAAEAAVRSVLGEARQQQLAACRSLSAELRRVGELESLRAEDLAELGALRQRLAAGQQERCGSMRA